MPLVQACAMIFCATFMLLVLVADICSILSNPRLGPDERHRCDLLTASAPPFGRRPGRHRPGAGLGRPLAAFGPYLAPYRAGDIVNVGVFGAHECRPSVWHRLSRPRHAARILSWRPLHRWRRHGGDGAGLHGRDRARNPVCGHGGWTDSVLGRAADALISIPHLIFALVVVAAFGTSLPVLILMAAISYVPGSYRFARALALDINAMDFVEVARARGERTAYFVWAEILPDMIVPLLTDFGLRFVFIVLLLSGLSFLGLGIQPPIRRLGRPGAREHHRHLRGSTGGAGARRSRSPADHQRHPADRRLLRAAAARWSARWHLVEVSGLHVTAQGRRPHESTSCATSASRIERGESVGADRRIRLGQDHDRADPDGLCPARLPHCRRQRAHRRRGGDRLVASASCRSCAAGASPTWRRAPPPPSIPRCA